MKASIESFLITVAAMLLNRNVKRSLVVSRRDNNRVSEIAYELMDIARRIKAGYK